MRNSVIATGRTHTLLLVATVIFIFALFFQSFYIYSSYVTMPIVVLWLPYFFTSYGTFSKNERVFVGISFAWLFLFFFYIMTGYSRVNGLEMIRQLTWMMGGVMSVYVLKYFNPKEQNRLYFFFIVAILLLMYAFMVMGQSLIAIGEVNEAALVTNAWNGAMVMIISGISLIVVLHIKSFWPRMIAAVALILSVYVNVFIFQRGTNVIFLAVEIALVFFFGLKNKTLVWFLSGLTILVAAYVYFSGYLINFFEWLTDVVPSERLAMRFKSITYALMYEEIEAGGGSLAGRSHLIDVSWSTFTSSIGCFLFGAGEHFGDNSIIGHHSFMIDTLARYGIIGGVIFFVYFKIQYQLIMSNISKKTDRVLYWRCSVVFFIYLLRNFYGDMCTVNVNLLLMIFLPLTIRMILNYKTTNKQITL